MHERQMLWFNALSLEITAGVERIQVVEMNLSLRITSVSCLLIYQGVLVIYYCVTKHLQN
jgi:hypothetical protein